MIVVSKSGREYARCTICSRDIKVAASGVFDVQLHLGMSTHQSNEAKLKTYKPMTSFFGAKPHTSAAATKAEVLFFNSWPNTSSPHLFPTISPTWSRQCSPTSPWQRLSVWSGPRRPRYSLRFSLYLSLCLPSGSVAYRILLRTSIFVYMLRFREIA